MDDGDRGGQDAGAPRFTLEVGQRLSGSVLWKVQRDFFERHGIGAWNASGVPHYATNNPLLAEAYAEIVLGFLRDGPDAEEPVTILEIGSGSGRFAHLSCRALLDLQRRDAPRSEARFRYVMTDLSEANLAFWSEHRALQPLVEQGLVDFARFDVEHDAEVTLRHAGVTLSPGSLRGPLVVVANYVFDSIPQDAFLVRGGQLHESLLSFSAPKQALDPADVEPFAGVFTAYAHEPVDFDYYPEPAFNTILREHALALENKAFVFPSEALRGIERLSALSRGGFLLLSGDRSVPRVVGHDLDIALHGSFSLPVDHRLIGRYFHARGGHALEAARAPTHLEVVAFVLGAEGRSYPETRLAYRRAIDGNDPDELFNLRLGVQELYDKLDLGHLLSFIRMSRHDPRILGDCVGVLSQHLADASSSLREQLVRAVLRTWGNYYYIGEERDLAFDLGVLLHQARAFVDALRLFEESRRLYGDDPGTRWNMGLCHLALGHHEEALALFRDATTLGPGVQLACVAKASWSAT